MELVLDEPNKEDIYTYDKTDILIDQYIKPYISSIIIDGVSNIFGQQELVVRQSYAGC